MTVASRLSSGFLKRKSSLATPFGLSQTTIQQAVKNLFVQLPGSMLIGIAEGGALGRSDSKMMQFSFTAGQASADLPQAMSTAQLAKQHGDKLSPAAETACMALGFGLQDQLLKLPARKKLEKLLKMLQNRFMVGSSLSGYSINRILRGRPDLSYG